MELLYFKKKYILLTNTEIYFHQQHNSDYGKQMIKEKITIVSQAC